MTSRLDRIAIGEWLMVHSELAAPRVLHGKLAQDSFKAQPSVGQVTTATAPSWKIGSDFGGCRASPFLDADGVRLQRFFSKFSPILHARTADRERKASGI